MQPLAEACRVWFAFTLISAVLVLGLLTRVITLLGSTGLMSRINREDACICAAVLCFRTMLLFNPQIRVKQMDNDWTALLATAPAMVLMNHSSFFDFFLFTSLCPFSLIRQGHMRTVMSASLTKLPIVGKSIGDHSGSFKVYFTAKGSGFGKGDASDYSVDRDRQQVETDRMEEHISQSKGFLGFCPEGGMNKTPEEGLKPFRRGSFAQAVKFSTPIWGAALHGCTDAWPRDAKMGGYPCTVSVSLKLLMTPKAGATAAEVADASQEAMQAQLDDLASKGKKTKAA